ncbi:hypothetical protein RJ640_014146 [Escallonia rubra]|uniref:Uncharacterized protein n=1 Tax=Escallonia rubra TaxID=112253 RepID=A0AA88RGA2_9ASTE|nr:hypothetical protein RJ640_014146 [Escallonia rubra]
MLSCLRPSLSVETPNLHSSTPSLQGKLPKWLFHRTSTLMKLTNFLYACMILTVAGNSADGTPSSSSRQSPTVNLTREYALAVKTNSYTEIWSKIHPENSYQIDSEQLEDHEEQQLLAEVLHPDRECVQKALQCARPCTLTELVAAYFDQTEQTSRLCLLLYRSVHRARILYAPLHDLLSVLPLDLESDSLTILQCNQLYEVFLQFDSCKNPFPHPDSHDFNDMRCCFSQLKEQLECRLRKSSSRVRLIRRATAGSAICLIGTAVGATVTAVVIASHALVALVAVPFLPAFLPSKITKRELAHRAQLDAAKKGNFVLQSDLDTIDRLVARLHMEAEGDKFLIRGVGLSRGRDRLTLQGVAKRLHQNHFSFLHQLLELEEHLCLCFAAINRVRSLLLEEIYLQQTLS